MARHPVEHRTPEEIRSAIRGDFPWIEQRDQPMVIGTDLDALMSAALLYHYLGWQPIGVYNLKAIYAADGATDADLKDAVWVDLDIAREEIRSIGHHILTNTRGEVIPAHQQSLNPNLLRRISVGQFSRKYPLSTLHLLMWLINTPAPGGTAAPYLMWLPDSCWITAQGRWLMNIVDWLENWMPNPFLLETVMLCGSESYEKAMFAFLSEMVQHTPLRPGQGQTTSKYLALRGYQFRFDNPAAQSLEVQTTLNYLSRITGWKAMPFPTEYRVIAGVQNRHQKNLEEFLRREEVFSYVIPNPGIIRYTSFDDF